MMREEAAEGLGTALLLYVVVGSGIAAERLASDQGVELFAHAISVGLALAALIAMLLPVSGAHFNPAVTLALWRTGEIDRARAARYVAMQLAGAIAGVLLANWSFAEAPISMSATARDGVGLAVGEGLATFVLALVILSLVRTGRLAQVPAAVGAWVAAAVFATSSTGFANPAVTVSRMFTDTYTGIAPSSTPAFLIAQIVAALLAAAVSVALFPDRVTQLTAT